jgi:hypothetical protein
MQTPAGAATVGSWGCSWGFKMPFRQFQARRTFFIQLNKAPTALKSVESMFKSIITLYQINSQHEGTCRPQPEPLHHKL